jgi:hypothetical protein
MAAGASDCLVVFPFISLAAVPRAAVFSAGSEHARRPGLLPVGAGSSEARSLEARSLAGPAAHPLSLFLFVRSYGLWGFVDRIKIPSSIFVFSVG